MAAKTEAQEEFDSIIAKASASERHSSHPDDKEDYYHDREHSDRDEEEAFQASRVDDEMKFSFANENHGGSGSTALKLPHKSFDSGRTTGVKGVIADARNYEEARRQGSWRNRISAAARESSVGKRASSLGLLRDRENGRDRSGSELSVGSDEEEFMERWRQSRRDELVREGNDIRNRRTSPSVRRYGRFDDVNALGYLDAIEKVGRETVVVVFVYDEEVCCSCTWLSHLSFQLIRPIVCCVTSHPRRPYASRAAESTHPLCQGPLRRHRVRGSWCASRPRLQEPRRPLCKPHLHHRIDP